ncbi:hypothetical protein SAMN05444422_10938 [Halobiforma haloterrestris]|uniref:Uncharacterized protein n=1 Tax=Natronobacterium haloterrestre TaxID=148448 RepID=A0A1I1JIZ9_NATHA|nr:hypothetical protein [Halobiforma haloterrestris]SFC48517.1 hypothetical protein SAMN05444422_10938 [Halobiforma haloterrestris]
MDTHPTRRRLLQLGGAGATASLAGCTQFDLGQSDDSGTETDTESAAELEVDREPDMDPEDGITAIVQPDQEEFEALEAEIREEIESGDLEQMEAQVEFQRRQAELTAASAAEFESEFGDDDDLSIEAGIAEAGAFLLDGSDERLVDTLRNGEVDGLIPGEEYALMLEQQAEAPAPGDGSDAEDVEDTDDAESEDDGEDDP